jgi:hypothetical protein
LSGGKTGRAQSHREANSYPSRSTVLFHVIAAEVDGLFFAKMVMPFVPETSKIDRSMSIVVETEEISSRGNSPFRSRAGISDGLSGGI